MGESLMSLETAEAHGFIEVERGYWGHGDVSSNLRIWLFHNSIHIWMKPVETKPITNNN